MGKSTIIMVIFNSYVKLPEGNPKKTLVSPSFMGIIVGYDGDIIGIIMESYFIPSEINSITIINGDNSGI
jgi:hypothetical protein